jgi:hypothetical protein
MIQPNTSAAIAKAIHTASHCEFGKTARDEAFAEMAELIADALGADDRKFDRDAFINSCALIPGDVE